VQGHGDGPELGDLRGTYRDHPAVSARAVRVSRWLTALGVAVLVGWVLLLVLTGRADDLGAPAQVAVIALLTGLSTQRTPWTRLTHEGVVVSRLPLARQRTPWSDVVSIRLPGRWDVHSCAVLRNGPPVELPGLPLEVAQRLARVVESMAPAAPPPGPPPPRPPRDGPGEGWDGPFRRGRPGA